jgi:hypothetical protein
MGSALSAPGVWDVSAIHPYHWERWALVAEEFEDGCSGCDLADPEEEHPFDDFGFECGHLDSEFRAILFGHESHFEMLKC